MNSSFFSVHLQLLSVCYPLYAPAAISVVLLLPFLLQVTVPSELTALMSGERLVSEQHPTKAGKMVFRFRQEIPIPSYLVALVVGALESR